jgi:hypothetical protein
VELRLMMMMMMMMIKSLITIQQARARLNSVGKRRNDNNDEVALLG